jgi:hypothetical protein
MGVLSLPSTIHPGRIAHFGLDLAWKTILGSVVDVEGVGQVGAVRVLQEIWKRGGGDAVSLKLLFHHLLNSSRSHRNVIGQTSLSNCLYHPLPRNRLWRTSFTITHLPHTMHSPCNCCILLHCGTANHRYSRAYSVNTLPPSPPPPPEPVSVPPAMSQTGLYGAATPASGSLTTSRNREEL